MIGLDSDAHESFNVANSRHDRWAQYLTGIKMAIDSDKKAFVEKLIARGTVAIGPIQSALKQRFGSGLAPRDLGQLVRGKGKTKARSAKSRRGQEAPSRAKAASTRGSTSTHRASGRNGSAGYLIAYARNGSVERIQASSASEVRTTVEGLLSQGVAPGHVEVYARVPFALDVSVSL